MSDAFATPGTVAHQVPLSMGFSRQEYRSRLSFPSPGDFPNPGIRPTSPALQVDSLSLSHVESPGNSSNRSNPYYYLSANHLQINRTLGLC